MKTYEEMLDKAYAEMPKIKASDVRFEMPVISGIIQGNKTLVKNFIKIATHLRRDISHFMKFMLRELATTGDLDGNNASFVGRFKDDFLTKKLDKYVKEFVLCSQCGKPDTKLTKERGLTFKSCEACGSRVPVRGIK